MYSGLTDVAEISKLEAIILDHKSMLERTDDYLHKHWSSTVQSILQACPSYEKFMHTPEVLTVLKEYLGPNIIKFNYDYLSYIPSSTSKGPPVGSTSASVKNIHSDAWTGTSPFTISVKYVLSNVDASNTLGVLLKSHSLGLVPVQNRTLSFNIDTDFYPCVALDYLEPGDIVIWHAFLLHFSAGRSLQPRYSLVCRYSSLDYQLNTQERVLGYQTIATSPLLYISRLVGNDFGQPFRTLYGPIKIEERLSHLYCNCDINE